MRDNLKGKEHFDKWIDFYINDVVQYKENLNKPSGNPSYRPQYVYDLAMNFQSLLLQRYSRGDAIQELAQYFPPLLDSWEEAERLGKDVWTEEQQYTRHAWAVNRDHYIDCFWLVGLALSLNISDNQWQRLLVLIGNEGEDELLNRIIASRQPDRKIGTKLCYPKPYQRLLDAVNAPAEKQPKLLFTFVNKWYAELNQSTKNEVSEMYSQPYWYTYHTLEGGYFGYWCVEAVTAVKVFNLDDSLCLGHANYPGDLLRPDGLTTHIQTATPELTQNSVHKNQGWLSRIFRSGK